MASQNEDDPMKNRRIVQRPEQDLASLLIEALRKDAHCQESHRKLDEYLSTHQVNMAFRVPTRPFRGHARGPVCCDSLPSLHDQAG